MKPSSIALVVAFAALFSAAGAWLVLRHSGEGAESASEEDGAVETMVPVQVAKVQRATLRRYAEGYGTVEADHPHDDLPAAGAKVASPVAGVLAEAHCSEGQKVHKGDLLFQLDARAATAEEQRATASAAATRASLERMRATAEFAQVELDREKRLLQGGLASDQEVRAAELAASSAKNELVEAKAKVAEAERSREAASTQRSLLAIRAPLSGTVVQIHVNPGEAVDTTTVLAEVVDLDRLVATAMLPSSELASLRVGEPVWIHAASRSAAPSDGGAADPTTIQGTIAFVGLSVDPKTDSVAVRASLPTGHGLRPGQTASLRVAVEEHVGALAVPVESVVKDSEGRSVVSLVTGDTASQVQVSVGLRDGPLLEVQGEGIAEGATVVTKGAYGLPATTRVEVRSE